MAFEIFMCRLRVLAAYLLMSLLAGSVWSEEIVYNNAVTDLNTYYGPRVELGDEVVLESRFGAVESCAITSLTFEYVGRNFSGNEQARLRLYRNDGEALGVGARKPGTLLYESNPFNIMGSLSGLAYEKRGLSVSNVPGHFTWTIEFLGLAGTESAGLSVYSPPGLGNNYDDYWERSGSDWVLMQVPGVPMSFGAIIKATDIVIAESTLVRLEMLRVTPEESVLEVRAPAGRNCVMESSPDWVRWQALTNWLSGAAPAIIYDRSTGGYNFYRAKATEP